MHEHSLLQDLLRKVDTIAREEGSARVVSVQVRLGALAHISPDHLREHFERATQGTVAQGATLLVETDADIHAPHAQDILLQSVEVAT
jgi:hydrogenase nickel incorporation protein HypA/HybF